MKFLFTLLSIMLANALYGQIQLDSIVQTSIEYEDEIISYISDYEQGLLSYFEIKFDQEYSVILDIEYDADGKMISLSEDAFGDISTFDIKYNAEGLMDSVFYTSPSSVNNLGAYEYKDGKVSKFTLFQVPDGIPVETLRKEYLYAGDIVEVSFYSLFGGGLILIENYLFDSNGKLLRWTEQGGGDPLVDSLIYNNNSLQSLQRKDAYSSEFSELLVYNSDESLNYSEIANPADFLLFLEDFYGDSYQNIYWPIKYGTKVNSTSGFFDFEENTTEWFYSTATPTNVRVEATPFSVYPNPTQDLIRLDLDENLIEYTIYNTNGQVVRQSSLGEDQLISVKDLSAGNYTIVSHTKDEKYFFAQFVKQ